MIDDRLRVALKDADVRVADRCSAKANELSRD